MKLNYAQSPVPRPIHLLRNLPDGQQPTLPVLNRIVMLIDKDYSVRTGARVNLDDADGWVWAIGDSIWISDQEWVADELLFEDFVPIAWSPMPNMHRLVTTLWRWNHARGEV